MSIEFATIKYTHQGGLINGNLMLDRNHDDYFSDPI